MNLFSLKSFLIESSKNLAIPLSIFFSIFLSIPASADQSTRGPDKWLIYSDKRLGIAFQYPSQYKVWQIKNEIFLDDGLLVKHNYQGSKVHERVDLLMNGRSLNESDLPPASRTKVMAVSP